MHSTNVVTHNPSKDPLLNFRIKKIIFRPQIDVPNDGTDMVTCELFTQRSGTAKDLKEHTILQRLRDLQRRHDSIQLLARLYWLRHNSAANSMETFMSLRGRNTLESSMINFGSLRAGGNMTGNG